VEAQFSWHVTHDHNDSAYFYCFSAISCSGNYCTAAGWLADINSKAPGSIMFWHSTDGGNTWKMQNPGLPKFTVPFPGDFLPSKYVRVIQQIDSLNFVAICDSGLIIRTFNGGITWEVQDCHLEGFLTNIHFSDPMTGILTASDPFRGFNRIFITTNGGRTWDTTGFMISTFLGAKLSNCFSFGNQEFRVFASLSGTVYTTTDNWRTVDSTKPLLDSLAITERNLYFNGCNLTGEDVLILYGLDVNNGGFVQRSTDGGAHWEPRIFFPGDDMGNISMMSSLDHDTVLAAGLTNTRKILRSTNHGATWSIDSLVVDINFRLRTCLGLAMTSSGYPIGIFSYDNFEGVDAILASGKPAKSHVERLQFPLRGYLFPNPAKDVLNIDPVKHLGTIYIKDLFGRDAIRPFPSPGYIFPVDISRLYSGMYDILIDFSGTPYLLDKLIVTGK
jgi:photosystem II stability/assembly factor-like uncharacterized protein